MTNHEIRIAIMRSNLKNWEVAKILGIGETTFYRKMREELPEDEQNEIVQKIKSSREGVSND